MMRAASDPFIFVILLITLFFKGQSVWASEKRPTYGESEKKDIFLFIEFETSYTESERDRFRRFFIKRLLLTQRYDIHIADHGDQDSFEVEKQKKIFFVKIHMHKKKNSINKVRVDFSLKHLGLVMSEDLVLDCDNSKIYESCIESMIMGLNNFTDKKNKSS